MLKSLICGEILASQVLQSKFTPGPTFSFLTVRWRRKPRWLPVAKSKMFRVPVRPNIPDDENEELQRLHKMYSTQMRGIRSALLEDFTNALLSLKKNEFGGDVEKAEHIRCMQINDEWNRSIVEVRERRLAEQAKAKSERVLHGLADQEMKKEIKKAEIEREVLLEKEQAVTYITEDTIDAAIEHALSNTTDYNFSIDLDGNIYHGRDTFPTDPSIPIKPQESLQT